MELQMMLPMFSALSFSAIRAAQPWAFQRFHAKHSQSAGKAVIVRKDCRKSDTTTSAAEAIHRGRRAMELGQRPLVEDLVDLSGCQRNPWYAHIRLNEDVLVQFDTTEYHPLLQTVSVVAEESHNRYSSVAIAANGRAVVDFIRRHEGDIFILSLLDISILSGDSNTASRLVNIGVQQRCDFHAYLFCNPVKGVADARTAKALRAAKKNSRPLYDAELLASQLSPAD